MTDMTPESTGDYTPETPVETGGVYDPEAPQPGAPTEEELARDTVLFPPTQGTETAS
jgi:hypothetical protein